MQIDESTLKPKKRISQAARYGVLGVQLGKDLYNTLNNYCQKKGIIKTKLIRALVKAYLDQQDK
jgi:metal-responsive CopG/Arc/MetJ family transcriptional regulator